MNEASHALKEPLEDVFRKCAFLDLEIRPSAGKFSAAWTLCTSVRCGNNSGVCVVLMATPELATTIADNYLGIPEGSRVGQRIDVISELANVLAGQAFEIVRGGIRPESISLPALLSSREALDAWEQSGRGCKFTICTETETVGGLLVVVKDEWSAL